MIIYLKHLIFFSRMIAQGRNKATLIKQLKKKLVKLATNEK